MTPYQLVAAIVGDGGHVFPATDSVRVRMPECVSLSARVAAAIRADKPALLAALAVGELEETVRHIVALSESDREAYRAAVTHDLAALAQADAILAGQAHDYAFGPGSPEEAA